MLESIVKTVLYLLISIPVYAGVWNSPHTQENVTKQILFAAFSTPPKRLDPVISYNANEWAIIGQIYEPPLQYNYLKRPYELEPLTLKEMPAITYFNANGIPVDENYPHIAFSEYRLTLREDVRYQEHPAFVKNENGSLFYENMSKDFLNNIDTVNDFKKHATRKLLASDYVYAIKRMAVRQNHSPILDNMAEYIVGLKTFSQQITKTAEEKKHQKDTSPLLSNIHK